MGLKNTQRDGIFASVISDGSIRVKIEEGTPGAKLREGDLRDGTHYSKWEMVYTELSGFITDVEFYDGDYGKNIQVTIDDKSGSTPVILCLSTSSNFGEDFMKKLPSIDLSKEVTIKPYSFTDKVSKKLKKGISVSQGTDKITSFFSKTDGKITTLLNGFPEPDEKMDKTAWKMYFMTVDVFLVKYIEDNIIPKLVKFGFEEIANAVPDDEIHVDKMPFEE